MGSHLGATSRQGDVGGGRVGGHTRRAVACHLAGRVSRRERKLAFSSPRSGFPTEGNIYTMGADGSAQTPITSFDGDELYPAWSPDGTRVAFQQDPGLHPENLDLQGRRHRPAPADEQLGRRPASGLVAGRPRRSCSQAISRTPSGNLSDLFVMNAANGSGAVNITNTRPSTRTTRPGRPTGPRSPSLVTGTSPPWHRTGPASGC